MEHPTLPQDAEKTPENSSVFVRSLVRSGLFDKDQIQEALRSVPPDCQEDAQAVADHFVKTGRLSRFQARKLLQGAVLGLVLGPYQVLAPIGRGGMGAVYLARDRRNEQLLALKVLPPKRAKEEERLLARFRREMELCLRVSHPHITRTYESGEHQGVYYIAMEFIPGKNLYRLVGEEGRLNVSRSARLFAEVASGLEHAHAQGLIHRDLKPSNLMITPKDHIKILDLGLAYMLGEAVGDKKIVGGQGYVLGTMDYMAPEQTEDSSRVDARSDIYSLGCTLYYALTGQPPFPGRKSRRKLALHRTEEPVPVERLNAMVPDRFAAIVRKMMAKDPEQRYASAAALREELLPWVAGEPLHPLDRTGDQDFKQAVAVLETAEVSTEWTQEPIIVLPDRFATGRPDGKTSGIWKRIGERSPIQPPWVLYLMLGIVALIVGLMGLGLLAVAGLVLLWAAG